MSDASKDPEPTQVQDDDAPARSRRRRREEKGGRVKATVDTVRSKIASVVWLVAVVCALFLAVGALLIALNANQDNEIVAFVLDGARLLQGPFEDLFTFSGENAETKSALVNWGIAAVVFLIAGKILDRVIRP